MCSKECARHTECNYSTIRNFMGKRTNIYKNFKGIHEHEVMWLKKLQKMHPIFCILGAARDRDAPILYDNDMDTLIVNEKTFRIRCSQKKVGAGILSINGCDLSSLTTKPPQCKKKEAHANLLIIDEHNGTLVRFEPHGADYGYKMYDQKKLDNKLKQLAKNMDLQYIAPKDYQKMGPQTMENQYSNKKLIDTSSEGPGYCSAHCLMFLHMYLLTRTCLSLKKIARLLIPDDEKEAFENIRNYVYTIVKTCNIMKSPKRKPKPTHKS